MGHLLRLDRLCVLRTTSKPIQKALKSKSSLLISIHNTNASIGHVIIPKPQFSSCECINSHCRRFDLLIFTV